MTASVPGETAGVPAMVAGVLTGIAGKRAVAAGVPAGVAGIPAVPAGVLAAIAGMPCAMDIVLKTAADALLPFSALPLTYPISETGKGKCAKRRGGW